MQIIYRKWCRKMLHQQGIEFKLSCGLAFELGLTGRTWLNFHHWGGRTREKSSVRRPSSSAVWLRPRTVILVPRTLIRTRAVQNLDVLFELYRYRIFKRNLFAIMKGTVMMVATKKNAKINQKKRFMSEFVQPLRPTISPDRALSK